MMGTAVATMPDGIVKGPETDLPRNVVVNILPFTVLGILAMPSHDENEDMRLVLTQQADPTCYPACSSNAGNPNGLPAW